MFGYIGCLTWSDIELLFKIGIVCNANTSVDNAIDRIRKKYDVIIYHTDVPFVNSSDKIMYNFTAKYCNIKMGWQGNTYINTPGKWDTNIYEAKRRAIRAVARWILAHKCKKISIKSAKK